MEQEERVERDRENQQAQDNQREDLCFLAHSLQLFHPMAHDMQLRHQFLLREGVAVRGFSHQLQLLLDALQREILLQHMAAQIAMHSMEFGQAVFDGRQVDRGRGWGRWQMRIQKIEPILPSSKGRSRCTSGIAMRIAPFVRWNLVAGSPGAAVLDELSKTRCGGVLNESVIAFLLPQYIGSAPQGADFRLAHRSGWPVSGILLARRDA